MNLLRPALATIALAVPFAASSCTPAEKQDAVHAPAANVERTAPRVIAFSDDFPNVATKCDTESGKRIYVTTHSSSRPANLVVIDDPSCRDGK